MWSSSFPNSISEILPIKSELLMTETFWELLLSAFSIFHKSPVIPPAYNVDELVSKGETFNDVISLAKPEIIYVSATLPCSLNVKSSHP